MNLFLHTIGEIAGESLEAGLASFQAGAATPQGFMER